MLSDFLENLKETERKDYKLYLITRQLKPNIKAHHKALDKYEFKTYYVGTNVEIREELRTALLEKVSFVINKDFEVVEYEAISDNLERVYTYQLANLSASFSDVLNNQLLKGTDMPEIKSLDQIKENLWAYCIEVRTEHESGPKYSFAFRKLSKSTITGSARDVGSAMKRINMLFNTKSLKLEYLQFETFQLDRDLDCLFVDGGFLVFNKTKFESIANLEDEFKMIAQDFANGMVENELIVGGENIKTLIDKNPSFHRKITALKKRMENMVVDAARINKMKALIDEYNLPIDIVKDGKIHIDTEKCLNYLIKLLDDSYVESKQTGKRYSTSVKSELGK